jgi:AraC-like DNA-binding protein
MPRQSFSTWHLPREIEGVLLVEDHREPVRRPQERHFHDELELHFVDRGEGVFLLGSGRLHAKTGTLVWIPPRRDHLLLEASPDFRRFMLLFRPRLVRRTLPGPACDGFVGRTAGERSGLLPADGVASLRRLFTEVHALRARALPLFNAGMAFALARAFVHFESATATEEPAELHPGVRAALRLLRDAHATSLPDLASAAELSEAHLSKLFSSQVGMSITDFRNRLRLDRFLELYGDGDGLSALDAAIEAGFGSYPQFHRVFRKRMGYSPRAHRRRA